MTVDATELHFSNLSVTHSIGAEKEPGCWRMERLKDSPGWGIEYFYQLMLRWHTHTQRDFFSSDVYFGISCILKWRKKMIHMYDNRAKPSIILCRL